MLSVPAKVRLPVTATRSLDVPPTTPAGPSSKLDNDPEFNTSEPTVRVPAALLPGDKYPSAEHRHRSVNSACAAQRGAALNLHGRTS